MQFRSLNWSGRAAFVYLYLVLCLACVSAQQSRPDIVIFLTDDHGLKDSSVYGSSDLRTPNMQKLAERGMVFTNAYVASPSCAPSRAALLTGLMPARNGAEPNHSKPRAEIKKWPAYFQALGYEVAAFGKVSHYKQTADYGFDHFEHDTFHDHAGIPAAAEYLARRDRTKPLCLFVGSNWPHVPWPKEAPAFDPAKLTLPLGGVDTPATREWRARYAAAVSRADEDLGVVLTAAQAHLGQNTIYVMSSDHGAQWPFAKWNCYEAGLRVPLMIAWRDHIKPGSNSAAMVSWVDLLPTLLDAAGAATPADIDGRSFLPVLVGKKEQHRDRIFATHSGDGNWNIYPIRSVREGQWKYIRNLHPEFAFTTHIDLPGELGQRSYFKTWEGAAARDPYAAGVVQRYHQRLAEELYDLATDPDEQQNLAGQGEHAEKLAHLRSVLDEWLREQGDTLKVYGRARLLADPDSYGPNARSGAAPAAR